MKRPILEWNKLFSVVNKASSWLEKKKENPLLGGKAVVEDIDNTDDNEEDGDGGPDKVTLMNMRTIMMATPRSNKKNNNSITDVDKIVCKRVTQPRALLGALNIFSRRVLWRGGARKTAGTYERKLPA
jgi:hypothetical protein